MIIKRDQGSLSNLIIGFPRTLYKNNKKDFIWYLHEDCESISLLRFDVLFCFFRFKYLKIYPRLIQIRLEILFGGQNIFY